MQEINVKKFISIILAAFTAVISLSVTVFADSAFDYFDEYLTGRFENYASKINVKEVGDRFGLSVNDMFDLIEEVYYSHPEFYYVNNGYKYAATDGKIYYLDFDYIFRGSSHTAAQKKLDDAAKKVTEGITEDMSDVEKALYVHDYLILNCAYDNSLKKYSAYNCLVDRSCVCQGYSLAYMYILNNCLGIECSTVISKEMNHIWNYVKIDNNWYHVDLTMDDPVDNFSSNSYDRYGSVRHDNFLMSDSKCRKSSVMHQNWKVVGGYPAAADKGFDDAFWNGVNSRICCVDGYYYYTKNGGSASNGKIYVYLCRYDKENHREKILAKIKTNWIAYRNATTGEIYDDSTYSYRTVFSSLEYLNGKLYFNTNKKVYSYNPSTSKVKQVYTIKKGGNIQIFGMNEVNGKLRLAYRKDVTYPEKYLKLALK